MKAPRLFQDFISAKTSSKVKDFRVNMPGQCLEHFFSTDLFVWNLDCSVHLSTIFPDKCCEMSTQLEAINF